MRILYLLCLSIIAQSLCCMENRVTSCTRIDNVENIVPGITAPLGIGCVRDSVVVVQEEKSCTVYDVRAQRSILHYITEKKIHDFAISKQGTKVAFCEPGLLTVYNAVTGELEWQDNVIGDTALRIVFNLQCDNKVLSIDASDTLRIHCPGTQTTMEDFPSRMLMTNSLFAYHSQKTEIVFNSDRDVSATYNYAKKTSHHYKLFDWNYQVTGQDYTADGSSIVIAAQSEMELITYIAFIFFNDEGKKSVDRITLEGFYNAMLFHSNNKSLFLLKSSNEIECYDFRAKRCLHTIKFENKQFVGKQDYLEKRLALSPDGKKLFVALRDKCVMIPLAIEVFCEPRDRDKMFFTLFSLHHQNHGNPLLVNDLIYKIVESLWNVYTHVPYLQYKK